MLPGVLQGAAGRYRYDKAYVLEEPEHIWHEVEADYWMKQLEDRLPRGLAINAMLSVDYGLGVARVALMRDFDGMCCPTGGVAVVILGKAGTGGLCCHRGISPRCKRA